MKKFLFVFMLTFMCPLFVMAQDVIMKKDGNAVVCRVVEVNKSEVVYKRWSDLQGSNYVISLADVSAIQYENGEKRTFGDTQATTPAAVMPPKRQMGEMNDAELLNLAKMKEQRGKIKGIMSPERAMQKSRRLKIAAWTAGPLMVAAGVAMTCLSIENDDYYDDYWGTYVDDSYISGMILPGTILMAGGLATTTACLVRSHNIKKKYAVQSSPIYGHEFQFKNGTSLSTNVCSLTDGRSLTPSLGLGFNYNF